MDASEKMLPVPQLKRQNLPVQAVGIWNSEYGLFARFDRMDRGAMKRFMAPCVSRRHDTVFTGLLGFVEGLIGARQQAGGGVASLISGSPDADRQR